MSWDMTKTNELTDRWVETVLFELTKEQPTWYLPVEPLAIVIEPPEAEEPLPPDKFTEPPAELPCPE